MRLIWLAGASAVACAAAGSAHAVQYFGVEEVQRALFPQAASFRSAERLLTAAQRDAIAQRAGSTVRDARVRAWEALDAQGTLLGHLLVDDVTGKHEFITYALALAPDGKVLGLEIMDYRETYGGQIRDPRWRAQFAGKSAADVLRIDQDIRNISGATLSCVHVTDGVRRLLATRDVALK